MDRKSRIIRETHVVEKKKPRGHDNKSGNISGESIGGAARIRVNTVLYLCMFNTAS